jgi:hypothetical protein
MASVSSLTRMVIGLRGLQIFKVGIESIITSTVAEYARQLSLKRKSCGKLGHTSRSAS